MIINTFFITINSFLSNTSVFFTVIQYIIYCIQIPLVIIGIGLVIYQIISSIRFSKLVGKLEKRLAEKEEEKIKALQIERKIRSKIINRDTISIFVNFLLTVGFFCIFFGSICISVTLGEAVNIDPDAYEIDPIFVRLTTAYEERSFTTCPIAVDNEYAGYGNWTKFTENCFCMQKNHTFQSVAIVKMYDYDEFWICNNGRRHTRMRSLQSLNDVRGFCSKDFKPASSFDPFCVYLNFAGNQPSKTLEPTKLANKRSIHYVKEAGIIDVYDPFW